MISIKGLYHRYIREYFALYDINLQIDKGEKVAFVGTEDSGKTSLIRILTKLEKPSAGEVYINGKFINKIDYKTDLSVGYLPACPIFLNKKTVYQNLKYILKQYKKNKEEIEQSINQILEEFDIYNLKDKKVKDLSVFEKYILSVARLSVRKIDLLLIDGVFDKLDKGSVNVLLNFINASLIGDDTTVILATSNKDIASKFTEKMIYFRSGSIVDLLEEN